MSRVFAVAMMVNMALGLVGYLVVDGFNTAFLREIAGRTRQIASADVVVTSRLPWTDQQKSLMRSFASAVFQSTALSSKSLPSKSLPSAGPTSHEPSSEVSLVTMASGSAGTRLVEVRFVDDRFPLYPGIGLERQGPAKIGQASTLKEGEVWIFRELRIQLGLDIGAQIKIGDGTFTVADVVIDDPTSGVGGFSFAPRIFARLSDLTTTGLVGLGSRILYIERFRADGSADLSSESLFKLRRSLTGGDLASDIRVRSHKDVTEELARIQTYLNDYLSLIALASLFLAALGTSYLMDGQLSRSMKEFAILSSLGAPVWIGPLVFVLQCLLLGAGASLMASAIGGLGLPVLAGAMTPVTGMLQMIWLPLDTIVRSAFVTVLSGLALLLPRLYQLTRLKPALLLRGSQPQLPRWTWGRALLFSPALILWWLTSVHEAKSWTTGSGFAVACLLIAVSLSLIAWPLLSLFRLSLSRRIVLWLPLPWTMRLALRQLSRNPLPTVSTFIALAIGTSLISLIPQLQRVISREVSRPDSLIPQLFLFDIQDEQVEPLKARLQNMGAHVSGLAPMVRARLESVNGEPIDQRAVDFEGEREQKQREALQSRTQNLSYREQLSGSETLVHGEFVTRNFSGDGLPALSLEEGFAKRLNLKIGDVMNFDITGVTIQGQVTSIRKVRWTSFAPNFMILVQPGVLDDAPKIWVASAGGVPTDRVDRLQMDLVREFSNISVVDIKAAVTRMLFFVDKIGVAITIVAWLALLGGVGVLYAIAYARVNQRRWDMALLLALGGTKEQSAESILGEYLMIALAAVLFGIILGFGEGYAVATLVFKAPWSIADTMVSWWSFLIIPMSLIVAWIAIRGALRASVNQLLSENAGRYV
jgi:putative ABC transport system permease protein